MAVAVMGEKIRLDRYLAEMGKGSRSQIRQAAKKGRIQVNGQTEKQADRKVDPESDQVCMDGRPVSYQKLEYFMLYKPQNVVSATEDSRYRTVVDLLEGENRRDLFPVGRLDRDTEGLLLLTNDGELAHQLLSPRRHVDKTYFARITGQLPADARQQMAAGMTLPDQTILQPARLRILAEDEVLLTIQEGKFHQVKRMFEALGCRVDYLKRLSMGSLVLDETLKPGEYRRLTDEELNMLKECGRKENH
jgi:16S rRNA pseudouridine516 synthase